LVPPVLLETRAQSVLRAWLDLREILVLLVQRDQSVSKEFRESPVRRETQEQQEQQGHRDSKEFRETTVLLDLLALRETLVLPEPPVLSDLRVLWETLVLSDLTVQLDRREFKVLLVPQESRVIPD